MSSRFQVLKVKPMSGTSKTGNPYSMLIVSGVHTDSEGVIEVGEIIFMKSADRPLPANIVVGATYEPILGAYARDGKLSFQISSLKATKV